MEDAEEIYKQTGVPFCPCICCHFCIPGSPVCAMVYCEYRRKSRIQNLVKAFNSESLEKGIFLELDPETWTYSYNARGRRVIHPKVPALDVKMNVPKRREYCTNNGIEFFTLETLIEPQPQAIIRHGDMLQDTEASTIIFEKSKKSQTTQLNFYLFSEFHP